MFARISFQLVVQYVWSLLMVFKLRSWKCLRLKFFSSELNTFPENVAIYFCLNHHLSYADNGQQKIMWVFGWNLALQWGRKWALKRKNSCKTSLFFSSLAKSGMKGCLEAVFSHWYWVHLQEKFQKDFQETAWKNTEAFLWAINIFNNSSFNTFPGTSQNLPENVSIFSLKW